MESYTISWIFFTRAFTVRSLCLFFLFFLFSSYVVTGQTTKDSLGSVSQMPAAMQKSFFEIGVGYVGYPFSEKQLQPGYTMESVLVRHPAVRLVLLGYEITPYLHAQVTYMRPIWWVKYSFRNNSIPNDGAETRTVWMNVASATLKPVVSLSDRISLNAEGGLGVVTRHGIRDKNNNIVVKDLSFATITAGAGIAYSFDEKCAVTMQVGHTFPAKGYDQPPVTYAGAGFRYSFAPFDEDKLQKTRKEGRIFPKQWISLSYSTNSFGYGVNEFFKSIYLFWGGAAQVDYGFMASYQRNLFNGPKIFSFDVGSNVAYWKTNAMKEDLFAFSLYPVFRFNFLHNKLFDPYFFYILGGPTYLSHSYIDGNDTGKRFTFYDALGIGAFFGKERVLNAELRIAHYSNGNIFPMNCGVKIPLTFSFGYSF